MNRFKELACYESEITLSVILLSIGVNTSGVVHFCHVVCQQGQIHVFPSVTASHVR